MKLVQLEQYNIGRSGIDMKKLLFLLFILLSTAQVFAQTCNGTVSQVVTGIGYLTNAQSQVTSYTAYPVGTVCVPTGFTYTEVANQSQLPALYVAPPSAQALLQTAELWDFDHDAQLEASGVNWTNIQNLYPNANASAIQAWANIQCPVAENSVNWNNFRPCIANGLNPYNSINGYPNGWNAFYCGQGHVSGIC